MPLPHNQTSSSEEAIPRKKSGAIPAQLPAEPDAIISRKRSGWLRLLISQIALVAGGLVAALVLVEIGFRLVALIPEKSQTRFDRPNKFYLKSLSDDRPNPYVSLAKKPGEFRILVLGDSFTYGQGLQKSDTFSARLEQLLNLPFDEKNATVINWGVRGYSTTQEVALLKKGFEAIRPDLVLLQITLNDPELQPYRVTHPYLDSHGRVKLTNPVFDYWKSLRFAVERIINTQTRADYVSYYENLFENPKTFKPFVASLEDFKSFLTKKNTPSAAFVFPLFSHPLDKKYPFTRPHKQITAELLRIGIPAIDLRKAFANMNPERLQVMPGLDSHPNEIAQRIATEAVYERLVKSKLIPQQYRNTKWVRHR